MPLILNGAVVLLAFGIIGQDIVGLHDLLEQLLVAVLGGGTVRVIELGELMEFLLDFLLGRGLLEAEELVVVELGESKKKSS